MLKTSACIGVYHRVATASRLGGFAALRGPTGASRARRRFNGPPICPPHPHAGASEANGGGARVGGCRSAAPSMPGLGQRHVRTLGLHGHGADLPGHHHHRRADPALHLERATARPQRHHPRGRGESFGAGPSWAAQWTGGRSAARGRSRSGQCSALSSRANNKNMERRPSSWRRPAGWNQPRRRQQCCSAKTNDRKTAPDARCAGTGGRDPP